MATNSNLEIIKHPVALWSRYARSVNRRNLHSQSVRVFEDIFLRHLADEFILFAESNFFQARGRTPTQVLEIGSAGGIVSRLRPSWTTSDVIASPEVDVVLEASGKLPFGSNQFDLIILQDTLHHLGNLNQFESEALRVLSNDGMIVCREPFWGFLAQLVFRFLHPEDFSLSRVAPQQNFSNPMAGNQALAWALLRNSSSQRHEDLLPSFSKRLGRVGNGLAFLLSGGSTFTTRIDRKVLLRLHRWESQHPKWLRVFGFAAFIIFEPRPEKSNIQQ